MNCPRCHLPLQRETYEGVEIDLCGECWGAWLDRGELSSIIRADELEFSDAERRKLLDLTRASKIGPHAQLQCPKCRVFMEQIRYDESIAILLDRCPEHGVWLDAGELKRVQVAAEQSREIQEMVIRKLKLCDGPPRGANGGD